MCVCRHTTLAACFAFAQNKMDKLQSIWNASWSHERQLFHSFLLPVFPSWQNLLLLVERMNKFKLHVPFFRSTLCFGRTSEMLQFLLRWTASSAGSESSNFFHHILCFLSLLCCTSLILVVRPSKLVPVVVKYFHFSIVLFCRSGTVREEGCSLEACALGLDDPCTPAE